MHLETTPLGEYRPCCLAEESIKKTDGTNYDISKGDTIADAFDSEYMENMRNEFLAGGQPDTCAKCWALEESGGVSKRMISNEKFGIQTNEKGITFLDLKLGNICNLKCRICGGFSSSKWAAEEIKQGSDHARGWLKAGMWPRQTDSLWNEVVDMLPQIEHFEFTGGEPFMIQEHFDLLEKSVEVGASKKQSIHYNTNGTHFPEYAIKHIWPHFKDVEIAFSIDDIRGRFEYQRYGAKWDQVNENIKKFNALKSDSKNISTQICCTINIQNIYNLDNMADWIKQQNFDYVYYNYLHEAKEWNVQYLPIHLKHKIKKKLDAYDGDIWHYKQIQNAINFMMSAHLHTDKMTHKRKIKIKMSDQFRNESFAETFPEISELI
jgi:MoaA/NifB/PqqE/SkfB family radical SAM enzyme